MRARPELRLLRRLPSAMAPLWQRSRLQLCTRAVLNRLLWRGQVQPIHRPTSAAGEQAMVRTGSVFLPWKRPKNGRFAPTNVWK